MGECGDLVVSMLDCQSRGWGSNLAKAEICIEISSPPVPPANPAMMSTLAVTSLLIGR